MAYPGEQKQVEYGSAGYGLPLYGPATMMPGPKILNMGVPGVGKSWALQTILKAGFKPFVVFAEQPTPVLTKNPDIKWTAIKPRNISFGDMVEYATKVNTNSIDFLSKANDPNRQESNQFIQLLSALNDFVDSPTGEHFGPVDEWGPKRVLAIDGLTGITKMVLDLVTGSRAIRSYPEWNVAQDQMSRFIDKLTSIHCSVIVLAHLEPERDEVSGRVMNYPSTIGKKLPPTLARGFDEALYSVRAEGQKFFWDNTATDVGVKTRYLPPSEKLPQDYSAILRRWEEAGGKAYELVTFDDAKYQAQLNTEAPETATVSN